MKKSIYRALSVLLFRMQQQLQYMQPPEARAKQLLDTRENARQLQALLLNQFSNMKEEAFRSWPNYSWMGKDGIDGCILYLLAHYGMGNRTCVDFGAGTGADGNTFNLVMNHGFKGYMVDVNKDSLRYGQRVYQAMHLTEPVFIPSFIHRENIIGLCEKYQLPLRPEVMSIDIDSIDWYVLEAMPLSPAILVLEFNNFWGPEESFTVPYDPGFRRELNKFLYGGASLQAFYRLLIPKGYKLVSIVSSGFDAIFVKDNSRFSFIGGITPEEGFAGSSVWQQRYQKGLLDPIRKKPWVAV